MISIFGLDSHNAVTFSLASQRHTEHADGDITAN